MGGVKFNLFLFIPRFSGIDTLNVGYRHAQQFHFAEQFRKFFLDERLTTQFPDCIARSLSDKIADTPPVENDGKALQIVERATTVLAFTSTSAAYSRTEGIRAPSA